MPRIKTKELIRLALMYAEQDRRSFLDAISNCNEPELIRDTLSLLRQLRAYRERHYGLNTVQDALDEAAVEPFKPSQAKGTP